MVHGKKIQRVDAKTMVASHPVTPSVNLGLAGRGDPRTEEDFVDFGRARSADSAAMNRFLDSFAMKRFLRSLQQDGHDLSGAESAAAASDKLSRTSSAPWTNRADSRADSGLASVSTARQAPDTPVSARKIQRIDEKAVRTSPGARPVNAGLAGRGDPRTEEDFVRTRSADSAAMDRFLDAVAMKPFLRGLQQDGHDLSGAESAAAASGVSAGVHGKVIQRIDATTMAKSPGARPVNAGLKHLRTQEDFGRTRSADSAREALRGGSFRPAASDGRTSAELGGGSFRQAASDARSSGGGSFRRAARAPSAGSAGSAALSSLSAPHHPRAGSWRARDSSGGSFRRAASDGRASAGLGGGSFRQAASDARGSGRDSLPRAGPSDGSRRSSDSSATTRTASSTSARPAKQVEKRLETVSMYMDCRRRASPGAEELKVSRGTPQTPGVTPSPFVADFLERWLPWLHLLLQAGLVLGGTALSLGLVALYVWMHSIAARH